MRKFWAGLLVIAALGVPSSVAGASAAHPTKAEKAYLKQLHRQVDSTASDSAMLHLGHSFCRFARQAGYGKAMAYSTEQLSSADAARLFLVAHVAIRTLCRDVGRKVDNE